MYLAIGNPEVEPKSGLASGPMIFIFVLYDMEKVCGQKIKKRSFLICFFVVAVVVLIS